VEEIMARAAKKRAVDIPEAKSAFSKLFELAMGPGLALAVLIILGAYLVINDHADEPGVYAAQHRSAGG
jgi:hypothetical protein